MAEEKVQLKREINLVYASSLMAGIMIGSGIFVAPVSIVQNCGSIGLSLIIWVASGILVLGIVLSYAELGAMYPRAGGEYAFLMEIMGPLPAFLDNWIMFATLIPTLQAVLALTTATYILKPFYPDCEMPDAAVKLLSVWVLVSLAALNSVEIKHAARFQLFFTITKLLALTIIIVTGIVKLAQGHTEYISTGFEGTSESPGAISTAVMSGFFTYTGWVFLFNLLEEVKKPEKVVPQASVLSVVSVIILYALTNVAYFTVMSPEEMAQSSAVAVTFAERTLGPFAATIPVFVACSTIGALSGAILGGARKYFAAARDGLFPDIMSCIDIKHSTPLPSLWLTCCIAIIYIVTGDALKMIEYVGFIEGFIELVVLGCCLYLRYKKPDLKRPIKMPIIVPALSIILLAAVCFLALYQDPVRKGIGILIAFAGVPLYMIGVMWKKKPASYLKTQTKMTILLQKVFSVVPQD